MISHALQIEIRIGSISLNRHNLQRPSKVLGVETRQRQSVAQAAHRRARLLISPSLRPDAKVRPVLVEHLDLARRVKVVPDLMDVLPLDAAALVADLHDHVGVAIAVADDDLDRRQLVVVLVSLHGRSHRVLQQLEQNVSENARNVREGTVLLGKDLDGNRLSVLTIAHDLCLISSINDPLHPYAARCATSEGFVLLLMMPV